MRSQNNAGCFSAFITFFIRLLILMFWISRPVQFNAMFSTFIFPCLGFIFLPLTTLMYIMLWAPAGQIQGLDWLWLGLAVVLDVASAASAGYANRNRIPSGYPGSTQAPGA